jgi:DNA repair protein RadC
MFMIREIPIEERPRERFLKYSKETIQTHELIAIVLRTGSKDESVLELSKRVLYQYDNLKELSNTDVKELTKVKGIGNAKAIELLAAFELGRRANNEYLTEKVKLLSPESIYLFLKDQFEMKTQEHFIALYLNTKAELIKKQVLFVGSLNSSLVHPREIFKHAVVNSAASIVIVHNHPSGDPTPSKNDIDVTKVIHQNSLMMDIKLVDHIIIGRNRYFSFKEKKIL